MVLLDRHQRPLRSLRISVTDRCNLRCAYCMPEEEYAWLPRGDLLSFEELSQVADAFIAQGVDRIRLTGGEPLVRKNLPRLVSLLAAKVGLKDLALTTNGLLLASQARALKEAGLRRVTVSLDTLRPERFRALTRRDGLSQVLAGIDAAREAGFAELKLDTVVIRGVNDDELGALLDFARDRGAELRFIEYMDVGGATHWAPEKVVSQQALLAAIEGRHGAAARLPGRGSAPAVRFALSDGTTFGIIASTTAPFCARCDRSRLTADGLWYRCLYATEGTDLRKVLREGEGAAGLTEVIAARWSARADRGAEQRLALTDRQPLMAASELKRDPHLEMHTRGG